MELGCIYMIVNPSNKIYIGQTVKFKKRINNYKNAVNSIKSHGRIFNSIKKYGWENHNIFVLLNCPKEELNLWEKFYIKMFDSFNTEHGMNLTNGGNSETVRIGVPKSEEWKIKMSIIKTGKKRKAFSKEWIENISKAHKNVIKGEVWLSNLKKSAEIRKANGGYVFSKEQIAKSKVSLSKYFKTEEGIAQRILISKRTCERFRQPILQYSLDGNFIKEWKSLRSVYPVLGINHSNISYSLNKQKTAGGFIWKKKEVNTKNSFVP